MIAAIATCNAYDTYGICLLYPFRRTKGECIASCFFPKPLEFEGVKTRIE